MMESGRWFVVRRIKEFYTAMNAKDFERCYRMIDPEVRYNPRSVTLHNYVLCLEEFVRHMGKIDVKSVEVTIHADLKTPLYGNRDFAVGQTNWTDKRGDQHVFQERWVKSKRSWFTRATGFVAPVSVR